MAPRLHATYMSILETLKMRQFEVLSRTEFGKYVCDKFGATENAFKTYQSENRFIVLL